VHDYSNVGLFTNLPGYLSALQVLILVIYPTPKTGKKQPPDPIVHPILFKEILVMLFSGPLPPPPLYILPPIGNGLKVRTHF